VAELVRATRIRKVPESGGSMGVTEGLVESSADASPLVSVVIPTVPRGAYLAEAVTSVLAQSMSDLELLVITNAPAVDCSCLPSDPRLRVFDQPLPGKAYAVNLGAYHARGKWLAFLDHDDVWEPDKLERQLQLLQDWEGLPACLTQFCWIDRDGHTTGTGGGQPVTLSTLLSRKLSYDWSSLLVDRALFITLGGLDPSYRQAGDLAFLLRLHSLGQSAFVPKDCVRYRSHAENMTHTRLTEQRREGARALADARRLAAHRHDWSLWRLSWRGSIVVRRWSASDHMRAAAGDWAASRRSAAVGHILEALCASPPDVIRLVVTRGAEVLGSGEHPA
jgi:glycosyltransferase involved in cell wall biosynthesis